MGSEMWKFSLCVALCKTSDNCEAHSAPWRNLACSTETTPLLVENNSFQAEPEGEEASSRGPLY